MFDVDSYSVDGPIVYDGEKSEKLKRDDLLEDGPYIVHIGAGVVWRHSAPFCQCGCAGAGTSQRYSVSVRGAVSTASSIGPAQAVAPGESKTFTSDSFRRPEAAGAAGRD